MKNQKQLYLLLFAALFIFLPITSQGAWWNKKPYDPYDYYWGKDYDEQDRYYVTSDSLNVRSCPSTTCHSESGLRYGDTVYRVGTRGNWYKVVYGPGRRGWVYSRYVARNLPRRNTQADPKPPEPRPPEPPPEPVAATPPPPPPPQDDRKVINLDDLREM